MADLSASVPADRVGGIDFLPGPAGDHNALAARVNLLLSGLPLYGQEEAYRDVYVPDGVTPVAVRCDDIPGRDVDGSLAAAARDVVLGHAVVGANINVTGKMTLDQLGQAQLVGGDMMWHSQTHSEPPPPYENLYDEIISSADAWRGTLNIDAYVSPGPWGTTAGFLDTAGEINTPLGQAIRRAYSASMLYLQLGFKDKVLTVPAPPHGAQCYPGITLADYQAGVAKATAQGGGVIFLEHLGAYGTAGTTTQLWTDFLARLDWLKAEQDAGRIQVMTPTALLRARRGPRPNLCPDPSFEVLASGTPANSPWSTTGAPAAGRLSGNSIEVGAGQNATLSVAESPLLRTIEITGWARAVSGSASARVVRTVKNGATTLHTATKSVPVTDAGWTFFRTHMGMDPRATITQIQLAQSTAAVRFDDITIHKS